MSKDSLEEWSKFYFKEALRRDNLLIPERHRDVLSFTHHPQQHLSLWVGSTYLGTYDKYDEHLTTQDEVNGLLSQVLPVLDLPFDALIERAFDDFGYTGNKARDWRLKNGQ